jgi:hypothetical protein
MVYLTSHLDNTFYFMYLNASVHPCNMPGCSDYVESITKHNWSAQKVLFRAESDPTEEKIESGGPCLGYFGEDDISNGGTKMLLTWTARTGQNASGSTSEYEMRSAVVDWVVNGSSVISCLPYFYWAVWGLLWVVSMVF